LLFFGNAACLESQWHTPQQQQQPLKSAGWHRDRIENEFQSKRMMICDWYFNGVALLLNDRNAREKQ